MFKSVKEKMVLCVTFKTLVSGSIQRERKSVNPVLTQPKRQGSLHEPKVHWQRPVEGRVRMAGHLGRRRTLRPTPGGEEAEAQASWEPHRLGLVCPSAQARE